MSDEGKESDLKNISLLIKSNPMEHRSIYENIRHIVNQVEKEFDLLKELLFWIQALQSKETEDMI